MYCDTAQAKAGARERGGGGGREGDRKRERRQKPINRCPTPVAWDKMHTDHGIGPGNAKWQLSPSVIGSFHLTMSAEDTCQ